MAGNPRIAAVGRKLTRRQALQAGVAAGATLALSARGDVRMMTREIPATGETLPVIGLGTYSVFDVGTDAAELAMRRDIVEALVEAGGSVVDSSPMYNRAERVVGDVLEESGLRDRTFLATKVWTSGRESGRRQMQRSADLMRTDVIDLMQVHNRRDIDVHWPTILELQEADRIRYHGVTDYRESAAGAMMEIMRRYRPQFIQINYSLGERGAEREVLPMAQELGIAVLVNRPFVEGRLFRAVGDRPLPDWATEFAASWAQFFLKFIVSHPAVTCAIPATSKLRHMVDNAAAGTGPMPDANTRQEMIRFVESL